MNLSKICLKDQENEKKNVVVCKDSQAESKSEYRLTNVRKDIIHKYVVDGCLINRNDIEKCDFLLTIDNEADRAAAVFVELKGKKFLKAISQINSSIEQLKPNPRQYKVFARIVMSAAPKLQGPEYTKLLEKTAMLGGDLKVKSRVIAETTEAFYDFQ